VTDGGAGRRPAAPPPAGVPGGTWALAAPTEIPALWGAGDEVAWAEGEAFAVVAQDGAGKTVLQHNLILRQLGVIAGPLLGLPVAPRRRVLYLAQDRPRQAARALRRMVRPEHMAALDAGLVAPAARRR
jgi:hypothetical protein